MAQQRWNRLDQLRFPALLHSLPDATEDSQADSVHPGQIVSSPTHDKKLSFIRVKGQSGHPLGPTRPQGQERVRDQSTG